MEDNIQFNPAAFKHGFSKKDIYRVIETKIYEGPVDGQENKYAIIGFDLVGNLLEIMYNIIDGESINIFHAMKCRKNFLKQLVKMKGNNIWLK